MSKRSRRPNRRDRTGRIDATAVLAPLISKAERDSLVVLSLLDGRDGSEVCIGPVVVHLDGTFECVTCHEVSRHFHGPDAVEPCGPESHADAVLVHGSELFSSCQRCSEFAS